MSIFDIFKPETRHTPSVPVYLHNTLGNATQEFSSIGGGREVKMYCCGPTVYGVQHIGNLSMVVFTDVLRRMLEHNGFKVKQVINITDFGHLSGDNEGDPDIGEDKMTKGLVRDGLTVSMENMRIMGEKYAAMWLADIKKLNVQVDRIEFPRASHYVKAQIAMIETLIEKGYAYQTAGGVYFDTSRFSDYGQLGNIDTSTLKEGAGLREGSDGHSARIAVNHEKRHPHDFVLWKSDKKMGWTSPWGLGFPGWHIECSAMIRSILGEQIDIHTGGIEHIPVHHNNEIAQSEAATGKKPFSRFWIHRAHLQVENQKIAKSKGNTVLLSDVTAQGYHPLALRYLLLGAHYRASSNFSWEALAASQTAFSKLVAICWHYRALKPGTTPPVWRKKFLERINDDLDTPGALAVIWDMAKDRSIKPEDLVAALAEFDTVLGLGLVHPDALAQKLAAGQIQEEVPLDKVPEEVRALIAEREEARENKSWYRADELRHEIEKQGFTLEDTKDAPRVFKK